MSRISDWKIGVVLLLFALPSGRAAAKDIYIGENIVFGPQEVTVEQCQQGPVIMKMPISKPDEKYLLQIHPTDSARSDVTAEVTINDLYIQKYVPTFHTDGTASLLVSLFKDNTLAIMVTGNPGASVTVTIFDHGRTVNDSRIDDDLWVSISRAAKMSLNITT